MNRQQKDKYNKTIKAYSELGKQYLREIEKVVPPERLDFIKLLPKNAKILDVGCAGGRDSKWFIKNGFAVTGIDLVDSFLEEAKRRVPSAKFIKMDLRSLKFPNNYFDAIWAFAVLLHISKKDIPKVLKGFYKILKPGGKLYIAVKEGRGVAVKKEKLSAGKGRLFTYFSRSEVEKFIKRANFKIISSKNFPDYLGRKNVKWICLLATKLN